MSDSVARMEPVRAYLEGLQDTICEALVELDGTPFDARVLENERGGVSRPRVLSDGPRLEKAAVNDTYARGDRLPPAATERRPELVGRSFEAASLSLIVHPRNPYAPTTHCNLRFFIAHAPESNPAPPAWWFGGGFDLTPYYGFDEDARHWHLQAKAACEGFGNGLYERCKDECDKYFFLPHRNEPRGIGGVFFDDLVELPDAAPDRGDGAFETCFAFTRSVGDHFLPAYLPILEQRLDQPYGEQQRDFQLYRRGRYVEFNLAHDRGTRYGLQVGGRAESILASLPPEVRWRYDWQPEPGTEEARLYEHFLVPQDWAADTARSADD